MAKHTWIREVLDSLRVSSSRRERSDPEPPYPSVLKVRVIFGGVFIFITFKFSIFWDVYNKTIIPLALVGWM